MLLRIFISMLIGLLVLFTMMQPLHIASVDDEAFAIATYKTSDCMKNKNECCPAAYPYTDHPCTKFKFAQPSNFNHSMTVPVPTTPTTAALPTCEVNRMTPQQEALMAMPQHFQLGTRPFSDILHTEANTHLQKMCRTGLQSTATVQQYIDSLDDTIQTARTEATQNKGVATHLNNLDERNKEKALRIWNRHCSSSEKETIKNACDQLKQFANDDVV